MQETEQNGFPPGRAWHSIKHKITFFLWTFRVYRKILCQILTPSITASLLSWTIVSALSFPPTLLTIILLFPPFPTLGFLPSHSQEHPLPPQPCRTITGSTNPSLSTSAVAPWANTGTGTLSQPQQLPEHLYPALPRPAGMHRDGRDALFSPEQCCALGISIQNAAPLNPVNIGRSCLPAGHRDGCWTGQSQHLTSSPAEELGDESPGCTAARGESRPTDLQCPPTQPASLQFVHGVQRRWAPKRMLN